MQNLQLEDIILSLWSVDLSNYLIYPFQGPNLDKLGKVQSLQGSFQGFSSFQGGRLGYNDRLDFETGLGDIYSVTLCSWIFELYPKCVFFQYLIYLQRSKHSSKPRISNVADYSHGLWLIEIYYLSDSKTFWFLTWLVVLS